MTEPVRTAMHFRVRHPVRFLRAALPDYVPLGVRRRLFAPLPKRSWGDAGAWESELSSIEPRRAIGNHGPPVSICIISHENLPLTRLCVESVMRLTSYAPFDLTVVDNGSRDGTAQWLKQRADIRAICLPDNIGFAAACNRAVAETTAPIVALLNNDVVVTGSWLGKLADQLIAHDTTGMVGPATNSCGNEARVPAPYSSLRGMLAFAQERERKHDHIAFEIPMLNFFCVVFRRETWKEVGPLDEQFTPALFEDADYARRVRAAGYRIVLREDAFVHHWGRMSLRSLGVEEHEIYVRNESRFRAKWKR